jgi:multiple sugar transport system ATP-binding protein
VADVTLTGVCKVFDNGFAAVSDVDLRISSGEFMVFVGPSGCGKSTLLRIIAGLEEATSGTVEISGQVVNDWSPAKRNVAMVFQNYALYPHMTVRRNLEFSLRLKRMKKSERNRMVAETAEMLGLSELLERRPSQLSGGQRQRVAMGRALVRNPSVFLLDEPLSNLDAKLRTQMRTEIKELQRRLGSTMVFVTHDQVEAMTMADRIAIIRNGVVQQIGTPQEVYDTPTNLFVADFIGAPPINLLGGNLVTRDGAIGLVYGQDRFCRLIGSGDAAAKPVTDLANNSPVIVGLRAEDVELVAGDASDDACIPGRVVLVEPLGGETLVHIEIPAERVATSELRDLARAVDETALEGVTSSLACRFVVKVAATLQIRVGDSVALRPRDDAPLHIFDKSRDGTPTRTLRGRSAMNQIH